jgi:hypothetical protein
MTAMEEQYDQDTLRKIELINRKIDQINERKAHLHTTKLEEELDCAELDDYIRSLRLTEEQQKIVDRCNRNNQQPATGNRWLYFIIMIVGVFMQFYIGYEIYRLLSQGAIESLEILYLAALIVFFIFNSFQMLRYLRIVR